MTRAVWLPGVVRKPIPQTATDPDIIPVGAIFHVAVSEAPSLRGLFGNDGGIESTGYIRRDGTIEQYRPVTVECDAQNAGNSWTSGGKRYGFTSWETQGMGAGEWTPEQLDSIRFIIGFHHTDWDVPLRRCPAWNAAGFGYHRLFEEWNTNHHSCPGDDRVKQFNNVIVPWLRHGAPNAQEDDMPLNDADKKWIADTIAKYTGDVVKDDNAKGGRIWVAHALAEILDLTRKIAKKVGA